MEVPALPMTAWIDAVIGWMHLNLGFLFGPISTILGALQVGLAAGLGALPPYAMTALVCALLLWRRDWRSAIGLGAALLLIWNMGLWREAIDTLSLVIIGAGISLLLGLPLGVLVAESPSARRIITPILDYMQTTPAFVYLIPSVLFFGVGYVPGIVATVMFALPPPVRATALGIMEVNPRIVEAGAAFGASRLQLLLKIKLPLALPHIRVGINQCIMMALTMVVIASLIGARGLGTEVVEALSRFNVGQGIEAGIAVVLVAVVLDRLSRAGGKGRRRAR